MAELGPSTRVVELRWPVGRLGCLMPLTVMAVGLFAIASVDPPLADDLARRRGGSFISLAQGATVAGVNVPLVLVALYTAWVLFRIGWRWADEIAVKATPAGLEPHPSTYLKPLAWEDVRDVSYAIVPNGRWTTPALIIELKDGSNEIVRGIARDGDAGARFVAYARTAIARASLSARPSVGAKRQLPGR